MWLRLGMVKVWMLLICHTYKTLTSILSCFARFLPEQMKQKKTKVVLCLRNPKDAAVSYFNHMRAMTMYHYKGEWKNWVGPYVRGQCVCLLFAWFSCVCEFVFILLDFRSYNSGQTPYVHCSCRVVICFWFSRIMDCMLFTFGKRVPLMR